MKKQSVIDPEAVELRRVLGPLQEAVKEGAMTPQQANATLGNVADSLVNSKRPKRKVGKPREFSASYGRRQLVWSSDLDQHILQ